ncbi:nardilysin-like [Gigantopelta aegis]|uniref:nardilysin-like n=1 Tax=Gigantopelta aegis TaxID=1735272 RepID=UPI001B88E781|nr:nardilysin-like [Gigantopelta aegis]XP_041356590.1 nardilysin-like [Gigantopelta aegis]XP_041356591.1 nardilysin-like [Gigantopelta aegis]
MSKDCCGCCCSKDSKEVQKINDAKLYTPGICSEGLPKPPPPPEPVVVEEVEAVKEASETKVVGPPKIAPSMQILTAEEIMLLLESSDQKATSCMEVLKSVNDKKEYRVLKLCNDLTVLLISDPVQSDDDDSSMSEDEDETEDIPYECGEDLEIKPATDTKPKTQQTCPQKKSAAAMCVSVGSFTDPPEIPGFAHFLEHMVFMGSKKYPQENDMDDFLSRHGGESNAWTDCERTTFYFDIQKKYFHQSLDKFANFFISPLMLKNSVDRELQAVDNEFQMSKLDDLERVNQLVGSTAVESHPMSKFMCGNLKSLKTDPEKNGIDVYARLRAFFEEHYGACYMTLAVQSQENLDDLQKVVMKAFSAIPSKYTCCEVKPRPAYLDLKDPFETKEFRKIYRVIPMEDTHRLEITWALPPMIKHYKEKPLQYLSALIGHEGKGSILSYLKKKFWALELCAGNSGSGFEMNSTWSSFYVNITLTECGLKNVYEVMTVVFQYILRLQQLGPQPWFYLELLQIEACKFRWKEPGDPVDYVESVSECMHLYPPPHYLMGKHLFMKYDEKMIKMCTDALQPHLANIVLLSKTFERQRLCDLEEPWFGTKYGVTDVEAEWLFSWDDMEPLDELQLPSPNPYIVTDFELEEVNNPEKLPYKLVDIQGVRMWFKKDTKFNVPKGYIYLNLQSPIVCQGVQCATLMQLFVNVLLHTLNELVYPAVLAGYEYCIEETITGVAIQMSGFSHKLTVLLKAIVDHIAEFGFSDRVFKIVSEQQKKSYYNEMLTPSNLAKAMRFAVLEPCNQPIFERYAVMEKLTPDHLRTFVQRFRCNLFVEGFVMGNFTPEKVSKIAEYIQVQLCSTLSKDQISKKLLLDVPHGKMICRVLSVNENDTNCCVTNYYQAGPGTHHNCCLNELLATRMYEPCFDTLRTKEQLGYGVYCRPLVTNGILGLAITVESQSSKVSLEEVDDKITTFLEEFEQTLHDMTDAEFHTLVQSVITDKESEDTHMGEEAQRYWREIFDHTYIFNRLHKEVVVLKKLSLHDLRKWFKQYLGKKQKKLSLQVYGRPMALGSTDDTFKGLTYLSADDPDVRFILNIEQTKKTMKVLPYTLITH